MIALVSLFCTLTVVAILPWVIIAFGHCTGGAFSRLECVLDKYESTLISLGILVLISGLALLTAFLTNKSTEITEKSNRKVQTEIQVAKFRQAWIIEMQNDLASFLGHLLEKKANRDGVKILSLYAKIAIRLNLEKVEEKSSIYKEPLAKALIDDMNKAKKLAKSKTHDAKLRAKVHAKLTRSVQKYLKNEWSRLKNDLHEAQSLENSP